jgi:hypothetical protein
MQLSTQCEAFEFCNVYQSPPLVSILYQINSIHAIM